MQEADKNEMWEWIKSILLAIVLALVIRAFLLEVFLVKGDSMSPTLHNRERILVSKIQYYYREPQPGEIVVFQATEDRDFIKRIIATAGDEVVINPDGVFVNGEKITETYIADQAREPYGPATVPEGTFFVMGDNRNNSMDSRHPAVSFVEMAEIKGKAMFIFWPLDNIRKISHP
ncbi:MAG TPA: signal peptidase I [Oscillospiraceae bacterium]|nr:signal peptidase I [Oscillospiraceae bacterium]